MKTASNEVKGKFIVLPDERIKRCARCKRDFILQQDDAIKVGDPAIWYCSMDCCLD